MEEDKEGIKYRGRQTKLWIKKNKKKKKIAKQKQQQQRQQQNKQTNQKPPPPEQTNNERKEWNFLFFSFLRPVRATKDEDWGDGW